MDQGWYLLSCGVERDVLSAKVKFGVADVAYPVVSLGQMIESGFTVSFDDYKCYMHRGNQRVEIFRKGRIFVLRMRRRVVGKQGSSGCAPLMTLLKKKWKLTMTMEK